MGYCRYTAALVVGNQAVLELVWESVSASDHYPTDNNYNQLSTDIQSRNCNWADLDKHSIQSRYSSYSRGSHFAGTGCGLRPGLQGKSIARMQWCRSGR